jgi:hypothetical protein
MPLLCGLDPRKIPNLAMWPLGAAADAGGAIPVPGSAGNGRGGVLGLPRLDVDRGLGRWWHLRSHVVAAAAASRGTPCSGELPAGACERAARSAPAGARVVLGWLLGRGS